MAGRFDRTRQKNLTRNRDVAPTSSANDSIRLHAIVIERASCTIRVVVSSHSVAWVYVPPIFKHISCVVAIFV